MPVSLSNKSQYHQPQSVQSTQSNKVEENDSRWKNNAVEPKDLPKHRHCLKKRKRSPARNDSANNAKVRKII